MINEIYYTTVVKQEAQELRNRAAADRLAREAKNLRRSQRANRREIERLEHAVHGKPSWWSVLLSRFGSGRGGRVRARSAQARTTAARAGRTGDHRTGDHQTGATTHKA